MCIEIVSGIRIFRWEDEGESGNIVPIAFPIIVGVATLTTILSLRTRYSILDLIAGIAINMVIIYISLLSLTWLEKKLGNQALSLMKKFFGIILLALVVQTFVNNL